MLICMHAVVFRLYLFNGSAVPLNRSTVHWSQNVLYDLSVEAEIFVSVDAEMIWLRVYRRLFAVFVSAIDPVAKLL